MGGTLAALQRLQEIETQLADLRNRIASRWRVAAAQEKRLGQLDAEIAADHAAVRSKQMEVDRLDLDVKTREAEIAKLRNALNAAKTNKEYAAILTQLNTFKVDSSKLEERELELLSQLDEVKKKETSGAERRESEVAKLVDLKEQAERLEAESKSRLDTLVRQREESAAQVPAKALELFERISLRNDGQALAMVTRTHPKREEFACESCNMTVTLQQVNALMSQNEPVICNNCGHILYLESHLQNS